MANTFRPTPSQEAAMTLRDKLILVSAAAGSGKTRVLTERIINGLVDHTADLSRMLVVTFTRAAAAELKSRIAKALGEALAKQPDDTFLSNQLFLLGGAQISTFDSFFISVVRDHFEELELPSNFRIADKTEAVALSAEILNETICELYDEYAPKNASVPFARVQENAFANAMNNLMGNRRDTSTDAYLLCLFDDLRAYPEGIELLNIWANDLESAAKNDFFESRIGENLLSDLCDTFDYYNTCLAEAGNYLDADPKCMAHYNEVFSYDRKFCLSMSNALEHKSYAEARAVLLTYKPKDFPGMQGKPRQMESYYHIRKNLIGEVADLQESVFKAPADQISDQLLRAAELNRMLYRLFARYGERIMEEKKRRGILEFNDVRTLLYGLLTLPDGSASPVAKALSERYDAVYIDEFQDTDYIQDSIFTLIGGNRRFMVGDIKQSIYGFRGSEPSIFSNYRNSMPLHGSGETEASDSVCVFMSENFRCDRPIINYANAVCSYLFSACKSLKYLPEDDLRCKKNPDDLPTESFPAVQTVAFEQFRKKKGMTEADLENGKNREARWIAAEISRLLREETDENGNPLYSPSDIGILVRKKAHGEPICEALRDLNIPVSAPDTDNILRTSLMTCMLNLLRSVDNPYRDYPLSEYLQSEIGGFNLEELTRIKQSAPETCSLFEAMELAAASEDFPEQEKIKETVAWFKKQMELSAVLSADRYLRLLYLEPAFSHFVGAPELLYLREQAKAYQDSSWCGLYGFLNRFSALLDGDGESASGLKKAEDAVQIMTIHHSKGLEMPVVFVAYCGAGDSHQERAKFRFHRKVGLASTLYNPVTKGNEHPILLKAVDAERDRDESEEKIRTLYVALTRARERLYVTGTGKKNLSNLLTDAEEMRYGSSYSILRCGSYLEWVTAAILDFKRKNGEFPCIFRKIDLSEQIVGTSLPIGERLAQPAHKQDAEKKFDPSPYQEILTKKQSFEYPLERLRGIPTKLAASKVRPNLLDTLFDDKNEEKSIELRIQMMESATPPFEALLNRGENASAAQIGTAMHAFMEFFDSKSLCQNGTEAEILRLVSQKYIEEETAKLLDREWINAFAKSDLMDRILAAKEILREQKFSLLMPLSELSSAERDDKILRENSVFVQGSIDMILRMPDGALILYDYKTDRVGEDDGTGSDSYSDRFLRHHGHQLRCYARAIENYFGKKPDEIYIYSLPLGRSVKMELF